MIGTFSVIALAINIACGAAVFYGLRWWHSRRRYRLAVGEPKKGARGHYWIGVYDGNRRIWQTAPPGHATLDAAKAAIRDLREGRIR